MKLIQINKLCIVTNNKEWKKNRNLHAIVILDNILNNKIEEPYTKFANDISVPLLSKTLVKSQISDKFIELSIRGYNNNLKDFSSTFLKTANTSCNLRDKKLLLKNK